MKKENHKNYLFLIFAALFICGSFLREAPAAQKQNPVIEDSQKKESTDLLEPIKRQVVEYESENLRDPFQGVNAKDLEKKEDVNLQPPPERPLPTLTVQGIVWGGNFNQAIINNKVVKPGDEIEGVRISSIDKNGIIVVFEGKQHNLTSPAVDVTTAKKSDKKSEGGVK